MKYRSKPTIKEAFRYPWELNEEEIPSDFKQSVKTSTIGPTAEGGVEYYIETLEGEHFISYGDCIIKGVKGEFYPCKPDIFEASYEKVE